MKPISQSMGEKTLLMIYRTQPQEASKSTISEQEQVALSK